MRKFTVIALTILLVMVIFALPTDIIPPHSPGFFLGFGGIGFSFGVFEIATNPINDLLGSYNLSGRFYASRDTVLNANLTVFDPQLWQVYLGNPYPSEGFYLWYLSSYLHDDRFFGRFVLKSHAEFADAGVYIKAQEASGNLNVAFLRLAEQVGFFALDIIELFGGIEMGMSLGVFASGDLKLESVDFDQLNQKLREETLYSVARAGLRWYYGDFVLELGYRFWLRESPLDFVQGFTLSDQIFNYYNLLRKVTTTGESQVEWNIPFITTPYYLTISAKF